MEPARELHAVGGTGCASHPVQPKDGYAWSVSGQHANQQAKLTNPLHYPAEALCTCGMVIRAEHLYDDWQHTGRGPGDPR